jgi:hypothetical protein
MMTTPQLENENPCERLAATTFESVKFVWPENHNGGESRLRNLWRALSVSAATSDGTEPRLAPFWSKRRGKMRKALAELDAEERAALLYLADLGTALCASGLVVSVIRLVVDVL